MRLSTTLLPSNDQVISDRIQAEDVAVVIDVLRATSVMCTALQNGADAVITCREVNQARSLAEQLSPRPLLCGERGCKPIDGFDLGNSPAEYVSDRIRHRTLVLTTTNGTRAIEFAGTAERVMTACFLNFSAVMAALENSESIHLVCAGTEGEVTVEDVLLAGALVAECETRFDAKIQDDDSVLAKQLWKSWFPSAVHTDHSDLAPKLRETRGGKNLLRVGYDRDLQRCAQIDAVQAVPVRISQQPITFALGVD